MENMNFETAYEKLNSLVGEIENSHLDLNSVIANYRQANDLLKYCENLLNIAQGEIKFIQQEELSKK